MDQSEINQDQHPAVESERDAAHVVHVTVEPVAEDVVWCDECEEWVTFGAPEQRKHSPGETCIEADERAADNWRRAESAEAALAALRFRTEGLAEEWDACDEHGNPLCEGSLSDAADDLRQLLRALLPTPTTDTKEQQR